MTVPDLPASPAYALTLFQLEPVNRFACLAFFAVASIFFACWGASMTEDSWLACDREGNAARCSVRSEHAPGIASVEPPALVTRAHTELRVSHDKHGDHPYRVLLLEVAGGPAREYSDVGKAGARAQEVAREVSGFLAGDGDKPKRWHLREPSRAAAAFGCAMSALSLVFAFTGFRRLRMELEPNTRVLKVRRDRWPVPAKSTFVAMGDVQGCEITLHRRGRQTIYRVGLGVSLGPNKRMLITLGIGALSEAWARGRMEGIEQQLAVWRQM